MTVMFLTLLFLIMPGSGHGQCSSINTTFHKNQRILLDLLTKNTPLHDGYYSSSVGNKSDQVYGVSQCKANISSYDCADCLNSSTSSYDACSKFRVEETISSICTIKISKKNIIGILSDFSTAGFENNGLDDPLVFSKGYTMMQALARTVPYKPLMYQAAEVDVGVDGKRYGLAQCGRDLSRSDCRECLEDRLEKYRSFVQNRTGWEILGSDCSMWYSNVSNENKHRDISVTALTPSASPLPSYTWYPTAPASVASGAHRYHGGIRFGTSIMISTFTILLLATPDFYCTRKILCSCQLTVV